MPSGPYALPVPLGPRPPHGEFANVDDFMQKLNDATSEEHRCMLINAQVGKPIHMCYWTATKAPKFKVVPSKMFSDCPMSEKRKVKNVSVSPPTKARNDKG